MKKLSQEEMQHVRLHRSRTETFYWNEKTGEKVDRLSIPRLSFVPEKQWTKKAQQ